MEGSLVYTPWHRKTHGKVALNLSESGSLTFAATSPCSHGGGRTWALIWGAFFQRLLLVGDSMKSAYELAMERLAKSDPEEAAPLSAKQKVRLAEIDRVYQGQLAEREIFLKQRLDEAYAAQNAEEVEKINQQLTSERARIEEEREAEKDQIRRGGTSSGR